MPRFPWLLRQGKRAVLVAGRVLLSKKQGPKAPNSNLLQCLKTVSFSNVSNVALEHPKQVKTKVLGEKLLLGCIGCDLRVKRRPSPANLGKHQKSL